MALTVSPQFLFNEFNGDACLTQEQLGFSLTLQNFCAQATSISSALGLAGAQFIGLGMKVGSLSCFTRILGTSNTATFLSQWGARVTGVVGEGFSFSLLPQILSTGSIETNGMFAGGMASTFTLLFCKASHLGPQGFVFQQFTTDCLIIGAEETNAFFGFAEHQRGSVGMRILHAQVTACQIMAGAGLVRSTCSTVAITEARLNLNYETTRRSIQLPRSIRKFFSPADQAVTVLGTMEEIPTTASEKPWQQKGGNTSAMSMFKEDFFRPDLKEISATQRKTPIISLTRLRSYLPKRFTPPSELSLTDRWLVDLAESTLGSPLPIPLETARRQLPVEEYITQIREFLGEEVPVTTADLLLWFHANEQFSDLRSVAGRMLRLDENFLLDEVLQHLYPLSVGRPDRVEFQKRCDTLFSAFAERRFLRNKPGGTSPLDLLAQQFGERDYGPIYEAENRFKEAVEDLVSHHYEYLFSFTRTKLHKFQQLFETHKNEVSKLESARKRILVTLETLLPPPIDSFTVPKKPLAATELAILGGRRAVHTLMAVTDLTHGLLSLTQNRDPLMDYGQIEGREEIPEILNRLYEARVLLEQAQESGADRKEAKKVEDTLKRRETLVSQAHLHGEGGWSDQKITEWETFRNSLKETPPFPGGTEIVSKLQALIGEVQNNQIHETYLPHSEEIAALLRKRLNQVRVALARLAIGEPSTPSEKFLLADLQGAFSEGREWLEDPNFPHDRLVVSLFTYPSENCSPTRIKTVVEGAKTSTEARFKGALLEAKTAYDETIARFNKRRKDPETPESQMLHVSETDDFDTVRREYHRALENFFEWADLTPRRWHGKIFPDLEFKREEESFLISPPHWKARDELSVSTLWRFLLDDTIGLSQIVKKLHRMDFDKKTTSEIYLKLHAAWGERGLARTDTRLRVSGSRNLIPLTGEPVIAASTHDNVFEFLVIPQVLFDYGFRIYIMADKKFYTDFPEPPTYGLLRALLGHMEEYGHYEVDRTNIKLALQSMMNAGTRIDKTGDSILLFPQGTRRRGKGRGLERYEDPETYAAKSGVAKIMEVSRASLLPIGMRNGARILCAQAGQAFLEEGVYMHQEYEMNFGAASLYSKIVPGNPRPKGDILRKATVDQLNGDFAQLTGRTIGPPAPSKDQRMKNKTA